MAKKAMTMHKTKWLTNLRNRLDPRLINLHDRFFDTRSLILGDKTPYEVVAEDGLSTLRYYEPSNPYGIRYKEPVVIVAPLAINMLIFDLYPERSLIRYLTGRGFPVYLIDWGDPNRKQAHYSFRTYINDRMPYFLRAVRHHSGVEDISLHGWSMAGIFNLLYGATHNDPHIKNQVVLGSPIDAYKSGVIGRSSKKVNRLVTALYRNTGLHPRRIAPQLLHSYGWNNALGFKLVDPLSVVRSYVSLFRELNDRRAVSENATLSAFLNGMVDYPGGINRDMLLGLWLEGGLASSTFRFDNQPVNLKNIHSNILAGAGTEDGLVTAAAVRPLADLTSSPDATFVDIPGGHMSLVGGEKSSREFWPKMADWLAAHSTRIDQASSFLAPAH